MITTVPFISFDMHSAYTVPKCKNCIVKGCSGTRITRIDVGPRKRRFTHVGLSAHAHNIVQKVEVHEWLLSGIEALLITILRCSFFDSCC